MKKKSSRYGKSTKGSTPWPLLSQKFQLLSLLGKGGFSEVYLVRNLIFFFKEIYNKN